MQLINRANLRPDAFAALQRLLPDFTTLQNFVAWGTRQTPPVRLVETVQQDEFTHDVIAVMTQARGETRYLIVGAT